jgi:predicted dehydrogenase
MMGRKMRMTRRALLKGAATAAVGAPYVVPSSVLAAPSRRGANDRINVASIGIRNMGGGHLRTLLGNPDAQVVAICDVDEKIRTAGLQRALKAYAARKRDGLFKGTDGYNDFRDVMARGDIDAVVVAVPDQWHAPIAVAACRAGKDVYVEKPMTLTLREGRAMIRAVRRHRRILQVGTQRRSSSNWRFACELVRNGRIGRLLRVETGIPTRPGEVMAWRPEPVPPELDYDLWLGPAPWAPYTTNRCHYNFRFIRDYSGGEMTNTGAHWFDIAQWGIGADETGPVEVQGTGAYHREGLWDSFHHVHVEWTYANGVKLLCTNTGSVKFVGTEGWVQGDARQAEPASILKSTIGPDEIHLYPSRGSHMLNFLDCVRTRAEPAAPVEVGHRTAAVCHTGNIAMTLGRKLKWDPVREEFPGDEEANRMMWRPYRSPWHL